MQRWQMQNSFRDPNSYQDFQETGPSLGSNFHLFSFKFFSHAFVTFSKGAYFHAHSWILPTQLSLAKMRDYFWFWLSEKAYFPAA